MLNKMVGWNFLWIFVTKERDGKTKGLGVLEKMKEVINFVVSSVLFYQCLTVPVSTVFNKRMLPPLPLVSASHHLCVVFGFLVGHGSLILT